MCSGFDGFVWTWLESIRSVIRYLSMERLAFLFIGQGKARVTAERKRRMREREREPKAFRIVGSFFSIMRVIPTL